MILKLTMEHWRAYRDVTLELDRPLVFFLAPNGVGKSSFFDAARCAIFGFPSGRRGGRAVSAGSERSRLSIELRLPDDTIARIERTLTRTGRSTFTGEHDGSPIEESAFRDLLEASWGAEEGLLARLMFGEVRGASRSAQPLPLREHLAELLGVTPMLEAATRLREAQSRARDEVADLRVELDAASADVEAAEDGLGEAQKVIDAIEAERCVLRNDLEAADAAARAAQAWTDYRAAANTHNERVQQILAELTGLVEVDPDAPAAALETSRQDIERELAQARAEITEAAVESAGASSASGLLASPLTICPTCLRPLTEQERLHALDAHGEALEAADSRSSQRQDQLSPLEDRRDAIAELSSRLSRLQQPAIPQLDDPGQQAGQHLAELRRQDSELRDRLAEARAHHGVLDAELQSMRTKSAAVTSLERSARQELLTDTVAEVLEAAANHYLSQRIEPLVNDIAHRWKLLFGSEGLVLDPGGNFRLRRGEVELEAEDMSSGELAVAGIIARLLITASATHIPCVWFDEPLEHLDPRRRSAVAQTLLSAVSAGSIGQIVVTTYEEDIARRLAAGAPDLVTLVHADVEQ